MDLEKETLKRNGTGLTGTRRILPQEIYELEGEDEKEEKPKGWLSWFQGIYRWDSHEADTVSEPSVKAPDISSQSLSSGPSTTTGDETKPTSILSKLLPTAQKNDSAKTTHQAEISPNNTTSESNSPPKEGVLKS